MKKEEIYIDLTGKSREELTDLWEFLTSNGEKCYRDKEEFSEYPKEYKSLYLCCGKWSGWNRDFIESYTEVTIDQLKQIIKPMGTFTPIAMRCNQEQFDAVKHKINHFSVKHVSKTSDSNYLTNFFGNRERIDFTYDSNKSDYKRIVHEEWNEEIFLKACGIEVESLEQQLQKAEAEVKRLQSLIEEENKPKIGDWVYSTSGMCFYKKELTHYQSHERKITNTKLIKLLNDEIK